MEDKEMHQKRSKARTGRAPEKKRGGAKSEFLSLRLDPKTRFVLDFVSRVRGQSITTVVERAIKEDGKNAFLPLSPDGRTRSWMDFWDPSEGVRNLGLISDPSCPTNYDEDELRAFAVAHREFFFSDGLAQKTFPFADPGFQNPRRDFVDVLWPSIGEFSSLWRETKSTDPWAAGRAMAEKLKAANLEPPAWPRNDVT